MPQKHAIGIDLGTTESVLAYTDLNGDVHTWNDGQNDGLIGSAVYIGQDEIVPGNKAFGGDEDHGILTECFKRDMGKSHGEYTIHDIKIPPEVLSALVLEHIVSAATQSLGEIRDAVISVPAYFDSKRRTATQEAGKLAGLNVQAIINEPTAAAIGFEFLKSKTLSESKINKPRRLLVYDFGGGTFDATVLETTDGKFSTMATDGDAQLGGYDLDEKIAGFLANKFLDKHNIDPRASIDGIRHFLEIARETKISLSRNEDHLAVLAYDGLRLNVSVRRLELDHLVEPFVERSLVTCEDALFAAGIAWSDLDEILLVGGTSQIPLVHEKLKDLSRIEPTTVHNPQELVAQGCSLYAANLSGDHSVNFDIANVNSHSLGIRGRDVKTNEPINHILIPRNTELPKIVRRKFVTFKNDQKNVSLVLLEGESTNPDLCFEVGRFNVNLENDTPKGETIEVFCKYNLDGTIHVSARASRFRNSGMLEIKRNQIEFEPLSVWKRRLLNDDSVDESQENPLFKADEYKVEDDGETFAALDELDAMFFALGKTALDFPVPPNLLGQTRFIGELEAELNKVGLKVKELVNENMATTERTRRLQNEGVIANLRVHERNRKRAIRHSIISLGRSCFDLDFRPGETEFPSAKVEALRSEIRDAWNSIGLA